MYLAVYQVGRYYAEILVMRVAAVDKRSALL